MNTAADRLVDMREQATGLSRPVIAAILNRLHQHKIMTLTAAAILAFVITATAYYWHYARFIISTDDAYAQADSTILASRISGYVSAVQVEDDQDVRAGQIL